MDISGTHKTSTEVNFTLSTQDFSFGVLAISRNGHHSNLWHNLSHRCGPVNVVYLPLP
jgi:hypothetical protein